MPAHFFKNTHFMLYLRFPTPEAWTKAVLQQFDDFLIDHAAAEKKASGMAISMLSHYPDKPDIVSAMLDLAIEEMTHFREVVKILQQRGLQLSADNKDPYVNGLRELSRKGKEVYFLDRLIMAGIIETRGHERFGLVAEGLPEGELQRFYRAITESEGRHGQLFLDLAHNHFAEVEVAQRLDELLDAEAGIVANLPIRAALH